MKTKLKKRWWFELPCYACAALIVQALLRAGGLTDMADGAGFSFSRLAIWCCCFYTVASILSFALWLAVLAIAPRRAAGLG